MNSDQFREAAHSALDESSWALSSRQADTELTTELVIDYYDTIQDRRVKSNVEPGYLRKLLPSEAPQEGEQWADIQQDIEAKIMPGLTHWYAWFSWVEWKMNPKAQ